VIRFAYWCERTFGRWSPVRMIHGGPDGKNTTLYLMRWTPLPMTPWGQLYVHTFYREDLDRDPHDHPFPFATFPLSAYVEEVFEHSDVRIAHSWYDEADQVWRNEVFPARHCFREQVVPAWRWSYRPAEHTHRILRKVSGDWPLTTIVWRWPTSRRWGFWTYAETRVERRWTHWKKYVFGTGVDNIEGDGDVACPGGGPR
jgi:hypothetical protein